MSGSAEEKSTKRRRWNVIDYMLMLLLAALALSLVLRYNLIGRLTSRLHRENAEITFVIEGVRDSFYDAMTVGDTIYLVEKSRVLGELQKKEISAVVEYYEKTDGSYVAISDDQRCNITGTMTVSGRMTENGFLLGGEEYLAAGSVLSVRTAQLEAVMTVLSVTVMASETSAEEAR